MNLREAILNQDVEVLSSFPILFDGLEYKYNHKERSVYFKLHLIKKNENSYVVFALTRYISDDDFIESLDAYDKISHPQSLNFQKEFTIMEEAKNFYDEVLDNMPKNINLKAILPETCEVYGYDERKSIHHDFFEGRIREKEIFEKEFIRHGYQRIMIRMFHFKKKIVVNKNLTLEFQTEEECEKVFQEIKEHFSNNDFKSFPCNNQEMELNDLFERFMFKVIKTSNPKIQMKRDTLDRIINFDVEFTEKGHYYSIKYSLPTRNGHYHNYTMKGSIYKTPGKGSLGSDYDSYEHIHAFKRKIEEIVMN